MGLVGGILPKFPNNLLGVGFKYVLFSSLSGEDKQTHFDGPHIFQMGGKKPPTSLGLGNYRGNLPRFDVLSMVVSGSPKRR